MNQTELVPKASWTKSVSVDDLHNSFIQNVSHELRTPLTIISGYTELLRDGSLGPLAPEQKDAMFVIGNRLDELHAMVEKIGILLAVEAQQSVSMPFELAQVVLQAIRVREASIAKSNLSLDLDLEPDLPMLTGDPYQLQHAIDCLLDNAIKFTPSDGKVIVQVHVGSDWAYISVADTGVGIPQEELEHILSGFYQVDGSTTRRYGGIGLGLTVAKAVVEAHAGGISVESEPGVGSRFVIRLPLQPLADQPETSDELEKEKENVEHYILVVDDEPAVAVTLQAALQALPNCQVHVATSGEEALQQFEQQSFDLLITDYKMPDTDGVTLAARIRQRYPETSVIMITAYGSEMLHEQATHIPIQRILDKPVRLQDVRSVTLEALNRDNRESNQPGTESLIN